MHENEEWGESQHSPVAQQHAHFAKVLRGKELLVVVRARRAPELQKPAVNEHADWSKPAGGDALADIAWARRCLPLAVDTLKSNIGGDVDVCEEWVLGWLT